MIRRLKIAALIALSFGFYSFCQTSSGSERNEDAFFLNKLVLDRVEKHQSKDRKFQNVSCPMHPSCSQFVKEEFRSSDFIPAFFFSLNRILYVENRFLDSWGLKRHVYERGRGRLVSDKPIDQSPRDLDSFKSEFKDD